MFEFIILEIVRHRDIVLVGGQAVLGGIHQTVQPIASVFEVDVLQRLATGDRHQRGGHRTAIQRQVIDKQSGFVADGRDGNTARRLAELPFQAFRFRLAGFIEEVSVQCLNFRDIGRNLVDIGEGRQRLLQRVQLVAFLLVIGQKLFDEFLLIKTGERILHKATPAAVDLLHPDIRIRGSQAREERQAGRHGFDFILVGLSRARRIPFGNGLGREGGGRRNVDRDGIEDFRLDIAETTLFGILLIAADGRRNDIAGNAAVRPFGGRLFDRFLFPVRHHREAQEHHAQERKEIQSGFHLFSSNHFSHSTKRVTCTSPLISAACAAVIPSWADKALVPSASALAAQIFSAVASTSS